MLGVGSDREEGFVSNEKSDLRVPAAITDTGCERQLNEDRYAVVDSPSGLTWLVCDGMGGVTGGELAAQLAIDAIRRDLENLSPRTPDVALRSAVLEANRIIVLRRQNRAFAGMGTTIVSAVFFGSEVVIGHVGDSRAYLVREGAIQQLTVDHTYVQELVDSGKIQPEEAMTHPQAHILTRCLGSEPGLEIDLQRYWIWPVEGDEPLDALVLCSDGLYSMVEDGEIAQIVSGHSPQQACVKLVELAKTRGGYDNITLSIIPLSGQLRNEAPPGYQRAQPAAGKKKVAKKRAAKKREPITTAAVMKVILAVVFLSVMSLLLTVLGVAFFYIR